MHKPVPMNTRVKIPDSYLGKRHYGTVVGVSFVHVVFGYIVLLDESHLADFGEIKAICVNGPELESEDGMTNWRFENYAERDENARKMVHHDDEIEVLSELKSDVHTRHCCVTHGCKYNDNNCTVTRKTKLQEYRCEDCCG